MSKPIYSPFADTLLYSHQYQGNTNDCGPFCAAIILNALRGLHIDGVELSHEMDKIHWHYLWFVIRRIPGWATFPWGMVDILREYKLEASWSILTPLQQLHEKLLQRKVLLPFLGRWQPLWAHIAVLVAYHDKLGWGFVNPAHSGKQLSWISHADFNYHWNALGNIVVTAWIKS
jgi:hypothetical protein